MQIGDRVILQEDFGPCRRGAEGIIKHVDEAGSVVVEITHDHECNDFTFLLPPAPESKFRIGSKCTKPVRGLKGVKRVRKK